MYHAFNPRPIPTGLQNLPSQVGLEAYAMLTADERALDHTDRDAWWAVFYAHCQTLMARYDLA